jgi:hypothetical protein
MRSLGETFGDCLDNADTKGLKEYILSLMDSVADEEGHNTFHEPYEVDVSEYLGGELLVVETEADLREIKDYPKDSSLAEGPVTADICSFVSDKSYVALVQLTNNAGGPTYFIPHQLINNHLLATIDKAKRDAQ